MQYRLACTAFPVFHFGNVETELLDIVALHSDGKITFRDSHDSLLQSRFTFRAPKLIYASSTCVKMVLNSKAEATNLLLDFRYIGPTAQGRRTPPSSEFRERPAGTPIAAYWAGRLGEGCRSG